jgi:hypothetical protein
VVVDKLLKIKRLTFASLALMLMMVIPAYFAPSQSYFKQSSLLYGTFVVCPLTAAVLMIWSVGVALMAPRFPFQPRQEKALGWYLGSYFGSATILMIIRLIWKEGPHTLMGPNSLLGIIVIAFSLVMLRNLWKNIPVTA